MVKLSVQAPVVHTEEDKWALNVQLNRALLELRRHGGGPVHINLETAYNKDFSLRELPKARVIKRVYYGEKLPDIPLGRIAIFIGDHRAWTDSLTQEADMFCLKYNGVVLCDHTSNYHGKYRVLLNIPASQDQYSAPCFAADLIIYMGNVSGTYMPCKAKQIWRINPDGEIRDTFRNLTIVFEMEEIAFFRSYNTLNPSVCKHTYYYDEWNAQQKEIEKKIPELPFSNPWVAQHTAARLPDGSVLYLGILNTLRSWNYFETPPTVTCYSNTGGFGIDGGISTLVGMSLADRDKLYFGVVGDLGFFYDMNALGNRHVGNNIRLMLINNGRGTEFRNYNHPAASFGDDADSFMAAAGHYGAQSRELVKHYALDLGYEYLSAANKEEYLKDVERFLIPELTEKPMVFEVFTDFQCESDAIKAMRNLEISASGSAKKLAKNILGDKGVQTVKRILKK